MAPVIDEGLSEESRSPKGLRPSVIQLLACAALLVCSSAVARDTSTTQLAEVLEAERIPEPEYDRSAATILASQPRELVARLMEDDVIILQEVRTEGPLRGAIVSAYLIFENSIDDVYRLLAQSSRQVEFRPELTSIEVIEIVAHGQIDEQRLRILFKRYVFRLEYRLSPEQRRIEWVLDESFDNDLALVSGYWELYEMADGRTLGRSGTRVDVGPAVPAFLQNWITRKNLPQTMERVRRWVNSEGSYRP